MAGPPPVRLYNGTDEPIDVVAGVAVPVGASGLLLVGQDPGGVARLLQVAVDGSVMTTPMAGGIQDVDNPFFPALGNLDVLLSSRASQATVASILAQLDVALSTRASEATLATRASEATLAARASEVTLASVLAQLDVALSSRASQATVASILAQLDVALSTRAADRTTAAAPFASRLSDGAAFYKATTPADTQPVSAVALPLPAGAATEATLATRAAEATVAAILAQLDVALSTRASAATQTDGTQKSIARGGAKGATVAADVTSTAQSVDRQGLDVQVRTSAGAAVDSFGGGTEYTEDVAAPADPIGKALTLVRQDAPAALTGADGDWVAQRGTNFGAAFAQIVTSAGAFVDSFGGGTEYTEDVASPADPVGKAATLRRRDTPAAETGADGDWVAQNGTNKGEAYVKHLDPVSTKTALTAAAPTFVAVGVASGTAVAANANRKGLILVNTSNRVISLGFDGAAAVLDSGVTLEPDGTFEMDEYSFTDGEVTAIASGAAANLAIQEFST